MNTKELVDLRSARGAKSEASSVNEKTLEFAISDCRKTIQEHSNTYLKMSENDKNNEIRKLISEHVMGLKYSVEGFVTEGQTLNTNKLIDKLLEEITDYGILTWAIREPSVYELRCNEQEIMIEQNGRCRELTDEKGKVLRFTSVEQQEVILRRLLGDVKITPKDALVNATTVEGYRIAVNHYSAMGQDTDKYGEDRYHSFVLRKFKKIKLELKDLVKGKDMSEPALSDNMAKLLNRGLVGGCSVMCAGPTASGKTTLLQAVLRSYPENKRLIIIQNPSEIDLRKKDKSGRVINDVLHLEAKEIENPQKMDPTMENLMMQSLRLSPVAICVGEFRRNTEIELGVMMMDAGHPLFGSTHAFDDRSLFRRILRGYTAATHESTETALPGIAEQMDLMVIQLLMEDGQRRVLQISEVIGVNKDNPTEAEINRLYEFKVESSERDELGRVTKINGIHKRVGVLSNKLQKKMLLHGVNLEDIKFLTQPIDEDEPETYTGENLLLY